MTNRRASDGDNLRNVHQEEGIEAFRQEIEEFRRELHDMDARFEPFTERRLRELAGEQFDTMLRSEQKTLEYLKNPDAKLREAALQIAYRHWQITAKLASLYEEMALSDPSDKVRDTAVRALGTCYARTKDQRIGRMLASLVRDTGLSEAIRLTAFASLLRLHGLMDYVGNSPSVACSLDEIDWDFVQAYYTGGA
jgi:hypothetical protein